MVFFMQRIQLTFKHEYQILEFVTQRENWQSKANNKKGKVEMSLDQQKWQSQLIFIFPNIEPVTSTL